MHAADGQRETGHGAGQVEVGRDAETRGIRVENVKVVSGKTRFYHHGFQAVDKQLRCVVTARSL